MIKYTNASESYVNVVFDFITDCKHQVRYVWSCAITENVLYRANFK